MCPAVTGATLFAVGVMLCPFPALVPSCRNLTAVLPELWDLLAAVYFHIRDELHQLLVRRSPPHDDG
ncbi:hypothetical protein OsI_06449 [Oryza sativa Indica Group]|uniref:Secreted protein n=4 Tax=Oryza TaxID=4527 RepID=Q6H5X6_ORYSJ|nr:hypothetical protein OsI_06449 [Oryza sativa Indica Group]EAZ22315.1 hypothetical protein OsJ_05969 [Oryza sativa Japonica Group]KAF2943876.1 hypothetical protein DAI22_02g098100 [Oryza sativa Japonica Group]BAD25873.1 hypothetical protein [Oryza sativa Japonica Group]BAD26159.1 hypothetical protein [Oryza sativa Japonica Group]